MYEGPDYCEQSISWSDDPGWYKKAVQASKEEQANNQYSFMTSVRGPCLQVPFHYEWVPVLSFICGKLGCGTVSRNKPFTPHIAFDYGFTT